ncbi:MAG: 16S rRNA (cytosine(1402)-N(4))-methyltransferase RsmH [Planctomycetota bacterium]|nr:16S rRNA (cytosine(1402)-N(4))-methyltransferase RsmH [Planctomycetota bacterium]
MTEVRHISVLPEEILHWIQPRPGQIIVDGTLGGGGHTRALAALVEPDGFILALDRDPRALAVAETNLSGLAVKLAQANFCELPQVLREISTPLVDAILLDLGLSSDQLADEERGFSFDSDGPLDLRFDPESGEPASRLVERLSEQNLADLIYTYGEERYSRRIAKAIVERRRERPIETANDLANIVRRAIPRSRHEDRIDAATRTFQALRIAVNEELKSLETALRLMPDLLKPNGRLAIISFHSLEDRRVKEAFRSDLRLNNLTKKPIVAGEAEVSRNARSRSAKLRVAQRVNDAGVTTN